MRHYLTLLLGIALITSCSSDPESQDQIEIEGVNAEIPDDDLFNYDTLQGMYMGNFGGSDIRLILNYVSKTNVVGYNIHKGLQRNLSGKVERHGDSITVYMAEPGDHEFDGVFQLLFIGENSEPKGTWKSNSGIISPKSFKLTKVKTRKYTNKDWDENEKITIENLHLFFGDAYDSLGEYSFKDDGLVIFSYYPGGYWGDDEEDEVARSKKQMKQIQGTWSMKDNKSVDIAWEANKILPRGDMHYQIKQGEYEAELYWKDNPIIMRMYP